MGTPLQDFRSQYPQYNDLSDNELADKLHERFYSTIDPNQFRRQLGLREQVPPPPLQASDYLDKALQGQQVDLFSNRDTSLAQFSLDHTPQSVPHEDWESEKHGFFNNSLRLAAERGSNLLGHASRGVIGRPGAALEKKWGMGEIVFGTDWGPDDPADGKFRVRYFTPQELQDFQKQRGTQVPDYFTETVPAFYLNKDFGGVERHTADQIKDAYHRGEIGGTIGAVMTFGLEQGIQSIPDMLSVLSGTGLLIYAGARSDEIGATRAQNKGKQEMDGQDQLEALPAAIGSALFEKFGAHYVLGRFGHGKTAEEIGEAILKAGYKEVAKSVAKEAGKSAAVEATTEFFQEGVIEYLGEKLGTDAPVSWKEAVERGFFGALGAGVSGGIMGGLVSSAGEGVHAAKNKQQGQNNVISVEPTTGADADINAPEKTGGDVPQTAPAAPTPAKPAAAATPRGETVGQTGESSTYFDPRLKNDLFRYNLAGMTDNITVEGSNIDMSDAQLKRAVAKALTGQKLGIGEARVVRGMLDRIAGEQGDKAIADYANEQLQKARQQRRANRRDIAADTTMVPLENYEESHAGELFNENEYLPAMSAEARIVDEMAAWLDYAGYQESADRIIDNADSTGEALQQLEVLQNKVRQAHHGTPHEVDKFSTTKIDTGEGAQAAGWGLYFAGKESTAKYYRQTVGHKNMVSEFLNELPEDASSEDVMDMAKEGAFNDRQAQFLKALEEDDWLGFDYPSQAISVALLSKSGSYDMSPALKQSIDGLTNLYHVNIPEDSRLLDRDRTLAEQPAAVKKGLDTYVKYFPESAVAELMATQKAATSTGVDVYRAVIKDIRKEMRNEETTGAASVEQRASERLNRFGIPGARYLDAVSRDPNIPTSERTHNYVIWDDTQIEITGKNEQRPAPPRQESPQAAPQGQPETGIQQTQRPTPAEETLTRDRRAEARTTPERRQDIARRERVEKMTPAQIVDELYTDPLTGLNNERALNEDLADARAVAAIDVDGLGGVNDHLGHDAGDWLLQAVGNVLGQTDARAYRKSGDEFFLLGDNVEEVTAAANHAAQELQTQTLETSAGKIVGINITTGVGRTRTEANTVMEASKKTREANGERMPKGQLPLGAVLNSQVMDWNPGGNYVGMIGMVGTLPLDADHNYQLGNGRTVRIPKKAIRRHQILKRLQRTFGNKIYQGRVKGKTRLGYYRTKWGEIRIKNANDIEVTAHELAHWIDDRFGWVRKLYKQYPKEMEGISYDAGKHHEGYAEFMRHWFTQEHVAREAAPGFYDAWMKALADKTALREAVYDLQEMMHAWYLQGARRRLRDRIDSNIPLIDRFRDATKGWGDKFLQYNFDDLRRFKGIERSLAGTGAIAEADVLKASHSGYANFRLLRGIHGIMKGVFHRGTINWNEKGEMEFTGKGLQEIFAPVAKKMRDMQSYMVARRAYELKKQGRENLIRNDEILSGLRLGEENPEFKEVFEEWQGFNKRMMDFYEKSGIIDKVTRKKIEEMNRNYVPFNRVVESALGELKVKRGGGPFMRLKGGTANINDIFENIIGNTTHLVQMSLTNVGKRKFYEMLARSDNQTAALYAAPIPKDTHAVNINKEQVLKVVVDAVGISPSYYKLATESGMYKSPEEQAQMEMLTDMIDNMSDVVTFFKSGQDPQGNVDFFFHNGKKVFFEIADPLLWDSLQHIGPRAHNLALGFLGGFSRALRTGVTATPTFQVRNFIRDTGNAFTLSKGHMIPITGAMQALVERVYNDEHYWEYMINGGGFASAVEASGLNRERVLDSRHKITRAVEESLSAFEYANRIAEFKKLREKGWNARDAALAGRDISTDFAMRGSSEILRYFLTGVPFLNARLQGLYRNGRELASLEQGKLKFAGKQAFSYALRSMVAITIPSLALYFLNRDDKRYQELPDWIRDQNWVIFTGDGEDDYWMIPKPFETGMLWGTLPERAYEAKDKGSDKELVNSSLWMATQTFNLQLIPQAYQPIEELVRNKDFTGAPIIPDYLQDVDPSEQYRYYTSDALIALARKTGISPLAAQHLVHGYFGTLGSWGLGMADMLVGDVNNSGEQPTKSWKDNILLSSFVDDGPLRRTHSEDHIYEMLKQTQQVVNTVRQISRRSPDRVEKYLSEPKKQVLMSLNDGLRQAANDMRDIKNAIDRIQGDPTLSGDEKRQQIFALRRAKNQLTRQVYDNINPDLVDQLLKEAEGALNKIPTDQQVANGQ